MEENIYYEYFEGSETLFADCYDDIEKCTEENIEDAVWVSQR